VIPSNSKIAGSPPRAQRTLPHDPNDVITLATTAYSAQGRDLPMTISSAAPPPATSADLSQTRLHLLRVGYLLMGVGLALVNGRYFPTPRLCRSTRA
jgi:hypothetical protein